MMKKKTIQLGIRVPEETVASLNEVARRKHTSRTVVVKELLANCAELYDFLQAREERREAINGNLSEWLVAQLPGATESNWDFLLQVVAHARQLVNEQSRRGEAQSKSPP